MGLGGISIWSLMLISLLLLLLYAAPSIIALAKNHPDKIPIILINVFGGAIFGVGWFVAFIWCFINPKIRDNKAPKI